MQTLAECTERLASCEHLLTNYRINNLISAVVHVLENTLLCAVIATVGIAAYVFAKKLVEKKEVKALVESINKHATDTTFDLTVVVIRGSNIANFGVALTSLMRCIKHFVLGLFFFLPDLSTTYFHRSFVDLGGFGIGLVGIVNPAAACSMASDFLQFSWANS